MNRNAQLFVEAAEKVYGKGAVLTRDMISSVVEDAGVSFPY